jgi:tubby and related proteins
LTRSNIFGTNFSVYEGEEEIAFIAYESNLVGPKQPRKIRVVIPTMSTNGIRLPTCIKGKISDILKSDMDSKFIELYTKQPEWSAANRAFVLNFAGRVLVSSVKNFQIIHPHDLDYITLQFGKVRENLFNLDARYPFSLLQAFGVVLTSFDHKINSE